MTSLSLVLLSLAATAAVPDSVLLDFSAEWCMPCQQMSPIVSRLQREGYPIRRVDVDKEPDLANNFGIKSIPAFVLVINGQEVERSEGATSEGRLKQMLARIPKAVSHAEESELAVVGSTAAPTASPVKLAQQESEGKSLFQIPFFGKKKRDDQPVVFNDNATIRANPYDEQQVPATTGALDPVSSTTRIRVKDKEGINFGSGTVIESQTGRTIVLTCGHIFRDLPQDATIEVDVFFGNRFEKYVGQIVDFDLDADVGLIAISTAEPLPVSRMASTEQLVSTSDRVFSIGCGGGEAPSKESLVVTALNRYEGPHNIECTGIPKQGRSGGALFNQNGEVIGVCIAADPKERRGLYAGYQAIRARLEAAGLGHLYQGSDSQPPFDAQGDAALASADTQAAQEEQAYAQADEAANLTQTSDQKPHRSQQPRPQASPAANLENVGESEVICIIRPLDGNQAGSRVVVINRASPKFLSFLTNELNEQPHHTTASVRFDELPSGTASAGLRGMSRRARVAPPQTQRFERYSRSQASR